MGLYFSRTKTRLHVALFHRWLSTANTTGGIVRRTIAFRLDIRRSTYTIWPYSLPSRAGGNLAILANRLDSRLRGKEGAPR